MNEFLARILTGINSVVHSYGWSVVLFTLLIRLIIVPFDYKSRLGMRKTAKIQPELNKLQKKYANDRDKLNQKTSELYKREKINPLSSCLPMLLTMPILFWMFAAMRLVANEQLVAQVFSMLQGNAPQMEGWFWIKNIWMPDSPFNSMMPSLSMMNQVAQTDPAIWLNAFNSLSAEALASLPAELALTAESFAKGDAITATMTAISGYLQTTSFYANSGAMSGWTINLFITSVTVMKDPNGFFILPVLSAVSQLVMTKLNPTQPVERDAQGNKIQNGQQPNSMGFMTWFFPLFSLWICSSYNGMFALYWVASNLIAMAETFAINKYLDAKEAKAAQSEAETGFVK